MGRNSCCVKQKLRKGLWSPEEDEKLYNYITRFGVGCWSSVPKLAGLQRCGKSCRLRWINYLRPDLKRGMFSQEEEDLIINLHEALGNRWAQIAAQLPGRTDNEIKNFWNSSLKKKLMKQGIDPNTHKPMNQTELKHAHQACNATNTSSLQALQQPKGLPNLSASSQVFDPLFLPEFQANIDIPNGYQPGFMSQVRPSYDQDNINPISNPGCGLNSMPNMIDTEYANPGINPVSRMSCKYVMSEAKQSSSSCNNNQSCRIDDSSGVFFWDNNENKLDSMFHNQSSGDYSIYPLSALSQELTGPNMDCFNQI